LYYQDQPDYQSGYVDNSTYISSESNDILPESFGPSGLATESEPLVGLSSDIAGSTVNTPTVTEPAAKAEPVVSPEAPINTDFTQSMDPQAEEEIQKLMVKGVEKFAEGSYEEASLLFNQVMMKYQNNVDAILAYAVARFAMGDFSNSAAAVRKGIRLAPDVVNIPFDIRDRYGKLEDFDSHLKALENFVRSDPGDADGWLVLGFVRHFIGDRKMAATTFEILERRSAADADLAEIFLEARPIAEPQENQDQDVKTIYPEGEQPPAAGMSNENSLEPEEDEDRSPIRPVAISLEPGYEIPSP
jgi:tetratricopeptide (TPR) repeat protein